jgi:hypothetical protein
MKHIGFKHQRESKQNSDKIYYIQLLKLYYFNIYYFVIIFWIPEDW